jgi:hypothetical protein
MKRQRYLVRKHEQNNTYKVKNDTALRQAESSNKLKGKRQQRETS